MPSDLFWVTAWIKEPTVYTKFQILSRVNLTFSLIQLQSTKTVLVPYCFKVALYRVRSRQLEVERITWRANQIYNEIFLKSLKEGLIFIHCYLKYSFIIQPLFLLISHVSCRQHPVLLCKYINLFLHPWLYGFYYHSSFPYSHFFLPLLVKTFSQL